MFATLEEQNSEARCRSSKEHIDAEASWKVPPELFANRVKAGGFLDKKSAENLTKSVLKMQASRSHVDVMDFLNVQLPRLLTSGRRKLNGSVETNIAALQTSEKEEAEEAALKNGMCAVPTIDSPAPRDVVQHVGGSGPFPSKSATPASVRLPAIVQLRSILRQSPTSRFS
jgi:hypothetical protein